ncbi:MAG TPA: bifunctional 4-hydroxy-2-oxoglutarate aldolase/2-dehydro-3-deoxy-phosphogluconate aldolase [Planctomycetota bacterium]|nr:bifunctional 4-hydroxy-2-oxoglutarate aldolase/2-dehydro-3-deoxy-phosphogluconate aldolase [Planctomycetota bacterium]
MSRKETLARLKELAIAAVVRSDDTAKAIGAVQACIDGGVKAIEITFTVPEPIKTISSVKQQFGDTVLLGAGTVLSVQDAKAAIDAGATFIVSPITDLEVVKFCNANDIAVMPGAMTPTEIYNAWRNGADWVKVFPASQFGPAYFKALKAPLPKIPIMPTGGVSAANAGEWLAAGAEALAVGGELVDKKALKEGKFDVITKNARDLMAAVEMFRKSQKK